MQMLPRSATLPVHTTMQRILSCKRCACYLWRSRVQLVLMAARQFAGSVVAMVTPMATDGSVDSEAFSALLRWHVESNSDGVLIAGTTGEAPTLTDTERRWLIMQAVLVLEGRLPVIVGIGANDTRRAVMLARLAQEEGASAALCVVPYYNKPMQEGLYQHFAAVANASPLPLILYDVPGRVGVSLADETVVRLAQLPTVVGLKDACGDVSRVGRLREALGNKDFLLISGDDLTACDYMLLGGDGVMSVTANVAPAMMAAMTTAACAGDRARARAIESRLRAFHRIQSCESNPIVVKAALAMMGKIKEGIRLPLTTLSDHHRGPVLAALEQLEAGI